MPEVKDIQHSILIVSASEKFHAIVKRSLRNAVTVETRGSGATARRAVLERFYDMIVVDAPLSDEMGEELVLDIAEQCSASVLLVVPADNYDEVLDHVTDGGVLVITKPSPRGRIDKAIRFLTSVQNRLRTLEQKNEALEEKLEELRLTGRAKLYLIEKKHMTEDEAHRYIGKLAMDHGISRGRIAQRILEEV